MIRIGTRSPRWRCSYFVAVFPCYLNHGRHVLYVSPVEFIHRYMNGKSWEVNRVCPQYSPGDSLLSKEFCKWNAALTGLGQIKRMTWTRLEATTGRRGIHQRAKRIDGRERPLASPCRAREDQSRSQIAYFIFSAGGVRVKPSVCIRARLSNPRYSSVILPLAK